MFVKLWAHWPFSFLPIGRTGPAGRHHRVAGKGTVSGRRDGCLAVGEPGEHATGGNDGVGGRGRAGASWGCWVAAAAAAEKGTTASAPFVVVVSANGVAGDFLLGECCWAGTRGRRRRGRGRKRGLAAAAIGAAVSSRAATTATAIATTTTTTSTGTRSRRGRQWGRGWCGCSKARGQWVGLGGRSGDGGVWGRGGGQQ